jgi:hypothetical protein
MTPVLQGLDATIHEGRWSVYWEATGGEIDTAQLLMGVLKQDRGYFL